MQGLTVHRLHPRPDGGIPDVPDPPGAAVDRIPHDGMTELRQVDPDLVRPARFDIHLQEGGARRTAPGRARR